MMFQGQMPPAPPVPPPPFDPNLFPPPFVLLIVIAAIAATVIIFWPLMRALARRLEGRGGSALQAELEQLHARVGEVDSLQARVAELEERVDFTERLLAQAQPQGRISTSQEGSSR
jgi:hypothetical protein